MVLKENLSIQSIQVFSKMREMLLTHKDILLQLEKIERKLTGHDVVPGSFAEFK